MKRRSFNQLLALAVILLGSCWPSFGFSAAPACRELFQAEPSLMGTADRWIESDRFDAENYLTTLERPLPIVDRAGFPSLAAMVENRVRKLFELPDDANLQTVAPATPPRSGATVLVVEQDGRPLAVYKILTTDAVLAREILSNRYIQRLNLPRGRPARLYQIERVKLEGELRPAVVMEYVATIDMEALLKKTASQMRAKVTAEKALLPLKQSLRLSAEVLHDLHAASVPRDRRPVSQEYKEREVNKMKKALSRESLQDYVGLGWLSKDELERLQDVINKKIDSYFKIQSIPGAFVHGDAHPGNLVSAWPAREVRLIDTENLFWSIQKEGRRTLGIGDPMADVGRFLGAFMMQAGQAGFAKKESHSLVRHFLNTYLAKSGWSGHDAMVALDIYFLRFAGVVLNRINNPHNTPEMQKQMLELVKEKFLHGL